MITIEAITLCQALFIRKTKTVQNIFFYKLKGLLEWQRKIIVSCKLVIVLNIITWYYLGNSFGSKGDSLVLTTSSIICL